MSLTRKRTKAGTVNQSVYSIEELAASPQILGPQVKKECVLAACRSKGVKAATIEEVSAIVNAYMKKEVK